MKFRFDHHTCGSFPSKNQKMQPIVQVQKDAQTVSSLSMPVEVLLASSYIFLHLTSQYWINIEGSRSQLTIDLTIERPVTAVISDRA